MPERIDNYLTVSLPVLKKFDLTLTEYCIAQLINGLAFNADNKSQWCYASRPFIAETLNITKNTVLNNIKTLIEKGLVETNMNNHLRTTKKWYYALSTDPNNDTMTDLEGCKICTGAKIVPVQKLGEGVQNLDATGAKIAPNIDNIKKDILITDILEIVKEKKTKFHELIQNWQKANPLKYPFILYEEFFSYWSETINQTESSKRQTTKRLRYEFQDFFDIGRRLATFWKNKNDQQKQQAWTLHKIELAKNGNK